MQSTNNKTPHLGTGGGPYGGQFIKYTHNNLWYFKPEEFARRQSSIKVHWNVASCLWEKALSSTLSHGSFLTSFEPKKGEREIVSQQLK